MKRLALAVTLLAACAGKVPETRYYQLATSTAAVRATAATEQPALAIEALDTEAAYDDERIVYRLTPYRLDYYNYHRWSSPPGALVSDFLERSFEHSGQFRAVTRETQAAPVALGGRVIAIEEIDKSKTSWVGHVVLELRLTDSASGEVLWTSQFEEQEPLRQQSPEGLAQALSVALQRIATRALPNVANLAAERSVRKASEGNASRSAHR